MNCNFPRRAIVSRAVALGLLWLVDIRAMAQRRKVGLSPPEVRARLIRLESDAARGNLLMANAPPLPILSSNNAYLESLPRLVELLDREAETQSPIADQAAVFLSEIHAQESVIPAQYLQIAGLRTPPPSFEAASNKYEEMFNRMLVRPQYMERVKWYGDRLLRNRPRYEKCQHKLACHGT